MSHSEDEDDFLSADEDIEDKCDTTITTTTKTTATTTTTPKTTIKRAAAAKAAAPIESVNAKVIRDIKTAIEDEEGEIPSVEVNEDEVCSGRAGRERFIGAGARRQARDKASLDEGGVVDVKKDKDYSDEDEGEEEDADEEAAPGAERIRERNLKIARNFSVEIAKNLRASAPIPVKASPASARRQRDYNDGLLSGQDLNGSSNPPAPPPTPALSSSFSNLNDQANQSGTSPSLSTQYSWRLPPKTAANSPPTTSSAATSASSPPANSTSTALKGTRAVPTAKTCDEHSVADGAEAATSPDSKSSEKARLALDRLSERLAQPEKNLFERVAADIRNMSITGDDSLMATDVTSQLNALPSTITDLGSTLGGWGWSGASKLLSSASQVTNQVGSVLNNIVDVSQQQLAPPVDGASIPSGQREDVSSSAAGVRKGRKED